MNTSLKHKLTRRSCSSISALIWAITWTSSTQLWFPVSFSASTCSLAFPWSPIWRSPDPPMLSVSSGLITLSVQSDRRTRFSGVELMHLNESIFFSVWFPVRADREEDGLSDSCNIFVCRWSLWSLSDLLFSFSYLLFIYCKRRCMTSEAQFHFLSDAAKSVSCSGAFGSLRLCATWEVFETGGSPPTRKIPRKHGCTAQNTNLLRMLHIISS